MNFRSSFSYIPERVQVLVFAGIFLLGGVGTYILQGKVVATELSIVSKQEELSSVLQLKQTYESRKQPALKNLEKSQTGGTSLATVESIARKTLVGGKLTMLKPAITKEDKGVQQMAIELRVTGAALGEIVSFLKEAESTGFRVKKVQLTVPQANPSALDMHLIMVPV